MTTREMLALREQVQERNAQRVKDWQKGEQIKMTSPQKRNAFALIRAECCNLDPDGYCLMLDHDKCPQLQTECLVCRWFKEAVLPLDKELEAEIMNRSNRKLCAVCSRFFVPLSNRAQYCAECAAKVRRQKQAAWAREARNRG